MKCSKLFLDGDYYVIMQTCNNRDCGQRMKDLKWQWLSQIMLSVNYYLFRFFNIVGTLSKFGLGMEPPPDAFLLHFPMLLHKSCSPQMN